MNKYISTYFYNDTVDLGANYGNIFLPLESRNLVYWQTVYTFFFTTNIFNKNQNFKFILFTNISNFPFREKLEKMGVIIIDDLELTRRVDKKWGTVNYFFDVINYISTSNKFLNNDLILMFDTDVIALRNSSEIFIKLEEVDTEIGFINSIVKKNQKLFHGLNINQIEEIGESIFFKKKSINHLIGGEFFGFKKNNAINFLNNYNLILSHKNSILLTTEEQFLTIINAFYTFEFIENIIFRVWNTLLNVKLPKNIDNYFFLHLPSDKEIGLNKLFNETINLDPSLLNNIDLKKLIFKCIPLNNRIHLYINTFYFKLCKYVKK